MKTRHLGPLVGLEAATTAADGSRVEAFAAWRRFLEALAEDGPMVLDLCEVMNAELRKLAAGYPLMQVDGQRQHGLAAAANCTAAVVRDA